MDIVFNVPVNRVSFGQVSYNLLKTARDAGHRILLAPIGPIDLETINPSPETKQWIHEIITDGTLHMDSHLKAIKLWHLATADEYLGFRGCYERYTSTSTFLSFYELDEPTPLEKNVAGQFDTVFSSRYTCEVFKAAGVNTRFVPLAFDRDTFFVTGKKYFTDDRIVFAMLGKFEQRKHHQKMIRAWVKRFGNDKRYYLQCAIYNPFFNPQMNSNLLIGSMGNKHYFNVNPIPWIPRNDAYNEFLNSNHIVLAMSGGEGWGLPEFHAVGLGKHAVILNAHAYKDWATDKNAVLVEPSGKMSAVDGVFFKKEGAVNQGSIFDWQEDAFIAACEKALERHAANPVNTAGLQLQDDFTYPNTLAALINDKYADLPI